MIQHKVKTLHMGKIAAIRELMSRYGIDAYIIQSTDEWRNEYTPIKRLEFISGFSGSNGVFIITNKDCILFTDDRYITQAKLELANDVFIVDMHDPSSCDIMNKCTGCVVGYDPMIQTQREVVYYENLGEKFNFSMQAISENLIDILMSEMFSYIQEKTYNEIYDFLPKDDLYNNSQKFFIATSNHNEIVGIIAVNQQFPDNLNIIYITAHNNIIYIDLLHYIERYAYKHNIKTITASITNPEQYEVFFNNGFHAMFHIEGEDQNSLYMIKLRLSYAISPYKSSKVFSLPTEVTGQSIGEKIALIIEKIPENANCLLLTSPSSICWLLNMRGNDIEYNPLALCYAIIYNREMQLFINTSNSLDIQHENLHIQSLDEFKNYILKNSHLTFAFDTCNSPIWFTQNIPKAIHCTDPTLALRAIKNHTELTGIKQAHIYDGIAICRFWHWLYKTLQNGGKVNELTAAEKLNEFRKICEFFLYESFSTISGYGQNSAIVHYSPKSTPKCIPSQGSDYIYLLDSGGQYTTAGTTDVTRVLDIGKIFGVNKYEHKRIFTLILKGHIAIAHAIFPIGTTGAQLDALARYFLWQAGLDYGHSTGHGVGHFLCVHEGPHAISKRNNTALQSNMIVSIEPGYYREGHFGMRVENLYYIRPAKFDGFLEFTLLTMVPIETSLIDFNMLTSTEIDWLRQHNRAVIENIKSSLSSEEVEFLLCNSKVI